MTNPATKTAIGPMTVVAIEQHEAPRRRIITDPLAHSMLPLGVKAIVRACAVPMVRRAMVNGLDGQAPGMWASFLCRKRYMDDLVAEALTDGLPQVVILGAGFDTRAWRLDVPASASVFEVDLPENIARKRATLRRLLDREQDNVHLVECDFETQPLAETLAGHGYRDQDPTVFVWEAVTQYLTEPAIRGTFEFLATAAPPSRLAFTYIRRDFLDGDNVYGGAAMRRRFVDRQRLWKFGWHPDDVAPFLREYGWAETEQLGPEQYVARYVAPSGRDLPVSEIERMARADKH